VNQVSNYVALILELRVKNLTEGGKQACKRWWNFILNTVDIIRYFGEMIRESRIKHYTIMQTFVALPFYINEIEISHL